METKIFKDLFSDIAIKYGFNRKYGVYYKESDDCIVSLDLQRSYYSMLYYVNIKVYVKNMIPDNIKNVYKDILKGYGADLYTRPPVEKIDIFELDNTIPDELRAERIDDLFIEYINPLVNKSLMKANLKQLIDSDQLLDLSTIRDSL